jgi:alpha-glucosidase (family GH31 glycosyl hydrolase)
VVSVPPSGRKPLRGGGIREVLFLRAIPRDPLPRGCEITLAVPRTEDGRSPLRPSALLPEAPRTERLRRLDRTAQRASTRLFELDGRTVRARARFPAGTSFYGAGLTAAPLLRTGRAVTLWNTDAPGYGPRTPALYQSHPFVLAVLANGRAVGLLADSTRRGSIAIAPDGVELAFEEEPFDLYRIEARHPAHVVQALAALVGRAPLPPLWALGYHQCRWSYGTADELRGIAREFRERGIPCDALWLDIDYMDRFRLFTWDRAAFPDPPGLVRELHGAGFHAVAIVDPGVAARRDFELCREGLEQNHFVLDARGKPAKGRVWPGMCHFPDFTSTRTRAWWAQKAAAFARSAGLDGLWCDMNEPSVFGTRARTLPDDARHAGAGARGPLSHHLAARTAPAETHARWHNLYGQLMAEATRAGLALARPDRRPFVLTRASHVSGARFAATWTGDNRARFADLALSIPMVLSLGLCGQPFVGPDAGGFIGDPSRELFARWFEAASLLPFFRGHSEKHARRKEPWAFGARIEACVRRAIERRMRLLPTLYTLFHEAATRGLPVVRPLFFADPADPKLRAVDDAFLLGDALLVAPVLAPRKRARSVLLPHGGWYRFEPGVRIPSGVEGLITARRVRVKAPLGALPLFAHAGAIVFECEPRERASAGFGDTLTVHVFLDARGRAAGAVYEDEGDGHGHAAGRFRLTTFEARATKGKLVLSHRIEGDPALGTTRREVRVHAPRAFELVEREA